ncbi:MAG TPA: class I SAM-dependent methyltransferase, partial [Opitutales bacterium]|nr:class I SAM-dependent methyltransferase [Opitutales bacterium]
MPYAEAPEYLSAAWDAYQLLDSGHGRKLERFGSVTIVRDEPKAWWKPDDPSLWDRADAVLEESGRWKMKPRAPRSWTMEFRGVRMEARLTDGSKHLGVFPEQEPHWSWMMDKLATRPKARVLNLFGYTGAASLAAAKAGALVTHVDASKPSIAWGRSNQELSGMSEAPIRWVLEDAMKYVAREVRRGSRYDAVLMDPPSFGRGPKGEVWKVEEKLVELLSECRKLLSGDALMVIVTLYNLEASPLMIGNLMGEILSPLCGTL